MSSGSFDVEGFLGTRLRNRGVPPGGALDGPPHQRPEPCSSSSSSSCCRWSSAGTRRAGSGEPIASSSPRRLERPPGRRRRRRRGATRPRRAPRVGGPCADAPPPPRVFGAHSLWGSASLRSSRRLTPARVSGPSCRLRISLWGVSGPTASSLTVVAGTPGPWGGVRPNIPPAGRRAGRGSLGGCGSLAGRGRGRGGWGRPRRPGGRDRTGPFPPLAPDPYIRRRAHPSRGTACEWGEVGVAEVVASVQPRCRRSAGGRDRGRSSRPDALRCGARCPRGTPPRRTSRGSRGSGLTRLVDGARSARDGRRGRSARTTAGEGDVQARHTWKVLGTDGREVWADRGQVGKGCK